MIRTVMALLALLAVGATGGRAVAADKVVLQLRWDHQFQFAGYYAALWQGYYAAAGLDVEIRPVPMPEGEARNALEEVESGRADFGIGAGDILAARSAGHPLVVTAVIFQNSPVAFYARQSVGLMSPADLVRLRVARRFNDLVDVEFQAMLRAEGIDPASVSAQPAPWGRRDLPDDTVDVVAGYTIDVPWYAERQGLSLTALRPASYGVDIYGDSLFTHQRVIDRDPDLVRRFTAASLAGWEYALSHGEAMADRIARDLPRTIPVDDVVGFNRFQIEGVRRLTLHPVIELGHINPARWERMHAILKAAGTVTDTFNARSLIFDPKRDAQDRIDRLIAIVWWTEGGLLLAVSAFVLITVGLRRTIENRTAALRGSEARYRSLFDLAPVMMHSCDAEGRLINVNRCWLTTLGYRSDEVIGRKFTDFLTAASHRRSREIHFPDMPVNGVAHGVPLQFVTRSGDARDIMFSALRERDAEGREVRVAVLDDITERRRAESKAAWAHERLVDAIESLPLGFVHWDADGRLVIANRRLGQIYPLAAGLLIPGASYRDVFLTAACAGMVGGDADDDPEALLVQRLVQRRDPDGPIDIARRDGRWTRLLEHQTSDGGIVTIVEDVTEDHRIRLELQAAKVEADKANQAKTRFLAAASHDLRQPLQALTLYLGLLTNRVQAEDGPLLDLTNQCLCSLTSLLNDLLDIAKLDAGLIQPQITAFPMAAVIDRVIASHCLQAQAKGLRLKAMPGSAWVRGDPALVERIVLNLVSNAVRYTDQGGVLVGCRRRGDRVRIEVWDTGIGIPFDKHAEIFQEFHQIGNSERNSERGTGLGLAIVDRLAGLLGCRVAVRSAPGRGSRFTLDSLPAARPSIQRGAQADITNSPEAFIVVIDDDGLIRQALAMTLADMGHDVVATPSIATAAEELRVINRRPDLVIADYRLGEGMTGTAGLHALRQAVGCDFPGVILTGDTAPDRIREVADSGFQILHKPVDPERLRAMLRRVL